MCAMSYLVLNLSSHVIIEMLSYKQLINNYEMLIVYYSVLQKVKEQEFLNL